MTRTDNDTWDLASSVGATATAVAASRAAASLGPDALLDDPFAAPLVRVVGIEHFAKIAAGEPIATPGGDVDPVLNRQVMNEQITVRTRFFDDFFTAATASGIRQAVILASGLDTRAFRLGWPSGTTVYELDQPEVIEFKTRTLSELGAAPTAERRTVSIDLRDDWPKALLDNGFDPIRPTAWIAEGLLVYLPPDAQDRLLDAITALSAPGSRVATEHMDMASMPADWAERLTERAQRVGSTINLAELFYTGERSGAGDYLAAHGWSVKVLDTEAAFAAQGFALPDDELASFSSGSGYLTATLT